MPTSSWIRPEAVWTLSILPASAGAVRPVAASWLVGIMCRAPGVASSRYLPVQDLPPCPGSARGMPGAWCASGQSALGRGQRAERLIIDVLRECATVSGTCRLMTKIGKVFADVRDQLGIPYLDDYGQRRLLHSIRHSVCSSAMAGWEKTFFIFSRR